MIKAIVFDAFGTLVRPVSPHGPYTKLAALLPGKGHLHRRHEMMTTNKSFVTWATELDAPEDIVDLNAELEKEVSGISLYDDVPEYLSHLKWEGYSLALCSNLAHAYGGRVKELLPDLDATILSYEVGSIKPEPAIYDHVVSRLGVTAGECLFVGDTLRQDVKGPQAVGMNALLLVRDYGSPTLREQVEPYLRQFDEA